MAMPLRDPGERLRTVTAALMSGVFALGAAVQFNDPDPWPWAATYLVAAALSLPLATRRVAPVVFLLVAAGNLGWAAVIRLRMEGPIPYGRLFDEVEMANLRIEQGREVLGLVIIGAWLAWRGWTARRSPSDAPPTTESEPE